MKERYIDLMEMALSAYTDEHIIRYYNEVKKNGLREHGFPRLTANIGILISHGRRVDLLPLFIDMMSLCCDMFLRPYVKAANEFSVREIVSCIKEIEDAEAVDAETVCEWKRKISRINPVACYNVIVKNERDRIANWAIFGAASEFARVSLGLGENLDFIDRQLSCQFQWLDENGMYCDNLKSDTHQPFVYDYVSRGLFAMILNFGYRGKYYQQMDSALKTAGILTLDMQSVNGEMPYGGRSNQFLHNEPWMAALFEYEARRYANEGNHALASQFKAAAARALDVTEEWLSRKPIKHIKNRFPTETKHGCEKYAYFDKYMITVASNLHAAYQICDDSIPFEKTKDATPCTFKTSHRFHKLFLKSGGYALEFDTDADPHYDASGLGRVHRDGAPSTISISCPAPADPVYTLNTDSPFAFSLSSAILKDGEYTLAAADAISYEVLEHGAKGNTSFAKLLCHFSDTKNTLEDYAVNANGVSVTVSGDGEIGYALPAFCFDGESKTEITHTDNTLTVSYQGWICRYTSSGKIIDLKKTATNRNGYYHAYLATAKDNINIKIEITKA